MVVWYKCFNKVSGGGCVSKNLKVRIEDDYQIFLDNSLRGSNMRMIEKIKLIQFSYCQT